MKKTLIASVVTALVGFSAFSASASDGTITINGKLTASTCKVTVNDSATGDATVALPHLTTSKLAAAGATGGDTNFLIKLSDCNPATGNVLAYFEAGANVDASTGRLNNTADADLVQVELLKGDQSLKVGDTSQLSVTGNQVALTGGAAELAYVARYYATGKATAGDVRTSVTYSVDYQ